MYDDADELNLNTYGDESTIGDHEYLRGGQDEIPEHDCKLVAEHGCSTCDDFRDRWQTKLERNKP